MPKKTADLIRSKGAHYCLCVKQNNKALYQAICAEANTARPLDECLIRSKGHGRREQRHVRLYQASPALRRKWCDVERFIVVSRRSRRGRQDTESMAFYISDLCLSAKQFCHGIRGHWAIENNLHWVKDVIMQEDDCTAKCGNSAANQAQLRSLIVSAFNQMFRSVKAAFCALAHNIKELSVVFHIA